LADADLQLWKRIVRPVAGETLGVRALAVVVESVRGPVLAEPSFAVVPQRFGLPPHPWELAASLRIRGDLDGALWRAPTLVITHFHYDHMMAPETRPFEFYQPGIRARLYAGKEMFVRSLAPPINFMQRRRGQELLAAFPEARQADGLQLDWIRFSAPLPHGSHGARQGWVLGCCIETPAGRFAFGSDSQLMSDEAYQWLVACEPAVVMTSGPPLFRSAGREGGGGDPCGHRSDDPLTSIADRTVRDGLRRLIDLARQVRFVIVDHHMARSRNFAAVLDACSRKAGRKIYSVADWLGRPVLPLEAYRKHLHRREPIKPVWYDELQAGSESVLEDLRERSGRLDEVARWLQEASSTG